MDKIKVGIVSLGLIGSSILKGLYKKYEVYCYSMTLPQDAFNYSKNVSNNLDDLKVCDIVFVCSPISKTLEMLQKLDKILNPETVVCDCASVKGELLNQKFNFDFVLSHPMAGSEKSGFSAGCAELFKGAKWLIEKNNSILEKIIEDLGAKSIVIDMKNHDYMCAQISHMPSILAYALFDTTEDSSKQIASSGFRDMTRLAMSDSVLISDMFKYNRENVIKAFDELIEKINSLKKLKDNEKINLFEKIKKQRTQMYDEFGNNIFKI